MLLFRCVYKCNGASYGRQGRGQTALTITIHLGWRWCLCEFLVELGPGPVCECAHDTLTFTVSKWAASLEGKSNNKWVFILSLVTNKNVAGLGGAGNILTAHPYPACVWRCVSQTLPMNDLCIWWWCGIHKGCWKLFQSSNGMALQDNFNKITVIWRQMPGHTKRVHRQIGNWMAGDTRIEHVY